MRILINTLAPLQKWFLDELKALGETAFLHKLASPQKTEFLKDAVLMVCSGGSRADAELLKAMPKLKLITVYGTGYDGIALDECRQRGIAVTNTPGVMKEDVADTACALLLNCARRFPQAYRHIKSGAWLKSSFELSTSLHGMRTGIAGMGAIGKEIARKLSLGFSCEIAYFARHEQKDLPYRFFNDLTKLASWAQALILILPGGKSTFHIVNDAVLKALGPEGLLINVGRGSLVDTRALIKALDENIIGGCGLDVFEREPCMPAELLRQERALLLPHAGSATLYSRDAMATCVLDNIKEFLQNGRTKTLVPQLKESLQK